jgi:hypothetical protein
LFIDDILSKQRVEQRTIDSISGSMINLLAILEHHADSGVLQNINRYLMTTCVIYQMTQFYFQNQLYNAIFRE